MGFFAAFKKAFNNKEPKKSRIMDDLQIEVVYQSPSENGTKELMAWSTFSEAAKYFELAKKVHFIGWGNPLEHPQIFQMLKCAKENCSQVEITTPGTNLTSSTVKELAGLQIDKITLTFNYPHVVLEGVSENISDLVKLCNKGTKVILDFIMTKDNITKLPSFTELAGDLQVDEIRARNIDFILSKENNQRKAFEGAISHANRGDLIKQGKAKGKEEYELLIKEAEKIANRKGLYFSARPLIANESVMCEYSPLKSLFLNWEGLITPCQYLALKNAQGFFNEKEYVQVPFIIGNINETDFIQLWNNNEYLAFREVYKRRVKIFNTYMEETFEDEPSAKLIFNNYQKLDQQLAEEKIPEICANCYKAYGI